MTGMNANGIVDQAYIELLAAKPVCAGAERRCKSVVFQFDIAGRFVHRRSSEIRKASIDLGQEEQRLS
ncbi:hypothetical protein SNOG_11007 [Parastagonospora nodorum SN15]|uniref:Uncharacterized protein n=1 Tax=Phaeosphaeria nodorum (strain SN15 / ATCC MYA-4574 / FGSC 10173) TaxID=321614 RepID=Q0UB57_PHANO|nr:hypothetical protein SNOG_11007 [Parastagonospora nodorum SN15]EAT81506.1 hypothetical protein SNOG_11007 [Parastagonospora nodorum SN15]